MLAHDSGCAWEFGEMVCSAPQISKYSPCSKQISCSSLKWLHLFYLTHWHTVPSLEVPGERTGTSISEGGGNEPRDVCQPLIHRRTSDNLLRFPVVQVGFAVRITWSDLGVEVQFTLARDSN